MNSKTKELSPLFLEDFDIVGLSKIFPEYEIGVHINRVFSQIAKYNQNPFREEETEILKRVALSGRNSKRHDSKYVIMRLRDVAFCFGHSLKHMPKTSFTQVFTIDYNYM